MTEDVAAEPRALELLEHAKATFASKGFDGASMQDLARAAGMSASNFYRYFPSKGAIIEALVEREIDEVRAKFAEVMRAPDPLAAFRRIVRERLETCDDAHDGPLWVEIEAAAARKPEFAALMGRMEAEVTRNLLAVFARIARLDEAEAEARFAAHARMILILVQGVMMRCGQQNPTPPDSELAALVTRLIEHTLSEIVAAAPRVDAALPS
jgi:AcrR family transcriptional regulator